MKAWRFCWNSSVRCGEWLIRVCMCVCERERACRLISGETLTAEVCVAVMFCGLCEFRFSGNSHNVPSLIGCDSRDMKMLLVGSWLLILVLKEKTKLYCTYYISSVLFFFFFGGKMLFKFSFFYITKHSLIQDLIQIIKRK